VSIGVVADHYLASGDVTPYMAPVYIGGAIGTASFAVATVNLTVPAAAQVGDIAIACATGESGAPVTPPAGWNVLGSASTLYVTHVLCWKEIAAGEPGAVQAWNFAAASSRLAAAIAVYRYCTVEGVTPTAMAGVNTTFSLVNATTTRTNSLAVAVTLIGTTGAVTQTVTNTTGRQDASNRSSVRIGDQLVTSPGSTTTMTVTSSAGTTHCGYLVVLQPTVPRDNAYRDAVLADAPLGYWRLGETSGTTMVDASGNGRDGVYAGGPTLGVPGLLPSDADKALGTGVGWGAVAHAAWMQVGQITLEAIIRPTTNAVLGNILDRDIDNVNRVFQFRRETTNKLSVIVWPNDAGAFVQLTGATNLLLDTSYHVVCTWDSVTLRLYVNGVQDAAVALARGGLITTKTTELDIGTNRAGLQRFVGTVDEAAIYGSALSAARIALHSATSKA
jgi:Concanavalin A-like lectin/glucanases superfamily